MSICEKTEQQLTDFYFGEGAPTLPEGVTAHLDSCSECVAYRAELVEMTAMLKAMAPVEEADGFTLRGDQRAVLGAMIDDIGSALVGSGETVAKPVLTLKRSPKVTEGQVAGGGLVVRFSGWYGRKGRALIAGVAMAACLCVVVAVLHQSEDLPTKSTATCNAVSVPLAVQSTVTDKVVSVPLAVRSDSAEFKTKKDDAVLVGADTLKSAPAIRKKVKRRENMVVKKSLKRKAPLPANRKPMLKTVAKNKCFELVKPERVNSLPVEEFVPKKRMLKAKTKSKGLELSSSLIATRAVLRTVMVPKFTYSSVKQAVETLQSLYNKRRKRMKWVRFSYQFHASQESLASTESFRSVEVLSKSLKMKSRKELGSVADIVADLCEEKCLYYQLQAGRVVVMDRLVTEEPLVVKEFVITPDLQAVISVLVSDKTLVVESLRQLARREGVAIEAEGLGGAKSSFDYDSKSGVLRVKNTSGNLAVLVRLLRLLPERAKKAKVDRLLKTAIPLDRLNSISSPKEKLVMVQVPVSLKMVSNARRLLDMPNAPVELVFQRLFESRAGISFHSDSGNDAMVYGYNRANGVLLLRHKYKVLDEFVRRELDKLRTAGARY